MATRAAFSVSKFSYLPQIIIVYNLYVLTHNYYAVMQQYTL